MNRHQGEKNRRSMFLFIVGLLLTSLIAIPTVHSWDLFRIFSRGTGVVHTWRFPSTPQDIDKDKRARGGTVLGSQVAIDETGQVFVVWLEVIGGEQGSYTYRIWSNHTDAQGVWADPVEIGLPNTDMLRVAHLQVVAGRGGTAYAFWTTYAQTFLVRSTLWLTTFAAGSWGEPVQIVPGVEGFVGDAQIRLDKQQTIFVAWEEQSKVAVIWRKADATEWTRQDFACAGAANPVLAVGNGNALLAWQSYETPNSLPSGQLAYFSADRWSNSAFFAHEIRNPTPEGVSDIAVAMSSTGDAFVVWEQNDVIHAIAYKSTQLEEFKGSGSLPTGFRMFWMPPPPVLDEATVVEKTVYKWPSVVADEVGNAFFLWQAYRWTWSPVDSAYHTSHSIITNRFAVGPLGRQTITAEDVQAYRPHISVSTTEALVAWSQDFKIWMNRYDNETNAWRGPTGLETVYKTYGFDVAMNGDVKAVVWDRYDGSHVQGVVFR
jgi:hypothetical protein